MPAPPPEVVPGIADISDPLQPGHPPPQLQPSSAPIPMAEPVAPVPVIPMAQPVAPPPGSAAAPVGHSVPPAGVPVPYTAQLTKSAVMGFGLVLDAHNVVTAVKPESQASALYIANVGTIIPGDRVLAIDVTAAAARERRLTRTPRDDESPSCLPAGIPWTSRPPTPPPCLLPLIPCASSVPLRVPPREPHRASR